MKLYGSLTSPYVRKVRICLAELALNYEFIAESPSDPDSHVARLNPLGKVPLFECDDGELLFNSPMIVEYIDSISAGMLFPVTEPRWLVQRWHALGDGIVDAVVARMLEGRRDPGKQEPAIIARQQGKVAAALRFADEHFSGGDWLVAGRFCLADIAFAVALGYIDFRYPHDWRDDYPRLSAWYATISRRPSFRATEPQE